MHSKSYTTCRGCHFSKVCFPEGLSDAAFKELDALVTKQHFFEKGDSLFKEGDAFWRIFVVRSGSFKTTTRAFSEYEKVLGFSLPGELLGLSGIGQSHYQMSASALEDSSVCEVSYDKLSKLSSEKPELQHNLLAAVTEHLNKRFIIPNDSLAEQRLALFLLRLSHKCKERQLSPLHLRLSMSRADLASYLGLVTETMSRIFSRFQKTGLLAVQRREVTLLDLDKIQQVACNKLDCELIKETN